MASLAIFRLPIHASCYAWLPRVYGLSTSLHSGARLLYVLDVGACLHLCPPPFGVLSDFLLARFPPLLEFFREPALHTFLHIPSFRCSCCVILVGFLYLPWQFGGALFSSWALGTLPWTFRLLLLVLASVKPTFWAHFPSVG